MSRNEWKNQIRNMVNSVDILSSYIDVDDELRSEIEDVSQKYPWGVTPYYASLMDKTDKNCPIRLQSLPSKREYEDIFNIETLDSFHESKVGSENPLWKENKSDVPCIVWRYPDRVVFHLTNLCAMYCRHCSRKVKNKQGRVITKSNIVDKGLEFIRNNNEIRDVLLSGGDPFLLDDEFIENILSKIKEIDHVEVIRIGTRTPCTLPQRITDNLCSILQKFHPIWINTQFNHPKEVTVEAAKAVDKLTRAGIPVGNQSVLLKGVNDDKEIMKELLHKLVAIRVRPYYLYHADLVRGTEHFRTSIDAGMDIIESLRGHTSGFAVPNYVICTPLGKTVLQPNYLISKGEKSITLRNYEWRIWHDPDL